MPPVPAVFNGPALFSVGFRPFFLVAIVFAVVVVPVWIGVYSGLLTLGTPFQVVDWHVHEMLFGYAGAVISGFLFTAIPNWTGRLPIRGWPLVILAALWLAGRLAVAGFAGLPPLAVMAIDCAFLGSISAATLREVIAGRNWRNLKVVVPVTLLFVANILFHIEAQSVGGASIGRRLGLSVVIFLIMLIGGRIIPSFTRNWLASRSSAVLPTPFNRFDGACVAVGATALAGWSFAPYFIATNILLLLAAGLHLMRLLRWRGLRTLASPVLFMLHIGYAFLPAGLFTLGLGANAAGVHLLGIGAIGGMTFAVMIRATLGHTGRAMEVGPALILAFSLLIAAAVVRSIAPEGSIAGVSGLEAAAGLWTLGFGIALPFVGPWLLTKRVARRSPNQRP